MMSDIHVILSVLVMIFATVSARSEVKTALKSREIRAGDSAEKLLDFGIPSTRRMLGRYIEFNFEFMPGYWGLSMVAKDGVLRRAVEWECTFSCTYFDSMTSAEEAEYRRLSAHFSHVPHESCHGRWGWERPPRWAWHPPLQFSPAPE